MYIYIGNDFANSLMAYFADHNDLQIFIDSGIWFHALVASFFGEIGMRNSVLQAKGKGPC